MKIRIGRPSCTGPAFPCVSPRPDSQVHSVLPIARSLTCPGISAQNHPNRLASGRATRKAAGPIIQVIDVVKNSAGVMLWYEIPEGNWAEHTIPPQHGFQHHEQDSGSEISPPRPCHTKVGVLAQELVGNPEARGIDEISRQPGEQELRRHALDQVRQSVRERNGDERRVAQKDDGQQHDQILQRFERLCARDKHDE